MLNHQDEQVIKQIIGEELEEKLRFVPSKDLFLEKMDELMGEVKSMREEFQGHTGLHQEIDDQLESCDQQIETINQKLNISY